MTEEVASTGLYRSARTAVDLAGYLGDMTLGLPPLLKPEEAASQALAVYENSGRTGATFSLYFGDMIGQPLYSVSLWPEFGETPSSSLVSFQLQPFIEQRLDLLRDPRCGVGLWYNADDDTIFVDVVAVLPDRKEAEDLAFRYDQIAIFDLLNLDEIATGGSGGIPVDIPLAANRLPQINQQEKHL